MKSITFSKSV